MILPILGRLMTLSSLLALFACAPQQSINSESTPHYSDDEKTHILTTANQIFNDFYQFEITQHPALASQLGLGNSDLWDDITATQRELRQHRLRNIRQQLTSLPVAALPPTQRAIAVTLNETLEFRLGANTNDGALTSLSSADSWHLHTLEVLINHHLVADIGDAHKYIRRLKGIPLLFSNWQLQIQDEINAGTRPTPTTLANAQTAISDILTGAPFTEGSDSPLWRDISLKIEHLQLHPSSARILKTKAKDALLNDVKPAYDRLRVFLASLPTRDDYSPLSQEEYRERVAYFSGSDIPPNEIHQRVRDAITALHLSMLTNDAAKPNTIPDDINIALQALYQRMQAASYTFPATASGREALVDFQRQRIRYMAKQVPHFFAVLPTYPLAIQEVSMERQGLAPAAYYSAPAFNDATPGIYYLNPSAQQSVQRENQPAEIFALTIPGRHMQEGAVLADPDNAEIMRLVPHPAITEGWSLYAQKFAIEMGGYFTDDEKFGQHVSELTLLVAAAVDTGIYQLGWNAADARKFIAANTPLTAPQTRALLQRINTHPGASTSAIMGNWALEHLREKTKKQLGDDFNIKEFHSALLSFGPVTPKELERLMSGWATQQKIRNSQPLIANEKAIDAIAAPDSSLNDDEQDEKESSIGELEIKASAP